MNAILKKYRIGRDEYLVYDTTVNTEKVDERLVRTFCTQNFGLSTSAILVGPLQGKRGLEMKAFSYEGQELPLQDELLTLANFLLSHVDDNTHPEEDCPVQYLGKVYCYLAFANRTHAA